MAGVAARTLRTLPMIDKVMARVMARAAGALADVKVVEIFNGLSPEQLQAVTAVPLVA